MQVVALHGEMDDAEAEALLPLAQDLLDGAEASVAAQAGTSTANPHRHVRRHSPRLFRGTCGTPARVPFGFRPAPLRFPPQLRNFIASCFTRPPHRRLAKT